MADLQLVRRLQGSPPSLVAELSLSVADGRTVVGLGVMERHISMGGVRFRHIACRRVEAEVDGMVDPALTVYHDGSCPLCRMEIGQYRRSLGAEHIDFVDVSGPGEDPGSDLPRDEALGRFHVRLPTGELRSGAAAFMEVWKVLPRWRPAARFARAPGVLSMLELGYRAFLPLRPTLAKLVRRFTRGVNRAA